MYLRIKNCIIYLPSIRAVEWGHIGTFPIIRIYYKTYGDATEIKFETLTEAQDALEAIWQALQTGGGQKNG